MDRFDALQAFVRVVEAGSFTKAAQTLHMSRTTVTQLVQQLEARLRVRLLHRTTRQVKVTPDGMAYYERVARLLADLDDADIALSSSSAQPRGRLRVDVPSPLACLLLLPALPAFHARYPDIRLDLGVSDRMVDVIGDNVDCVVRGGALSSPSLVARRVGDLQIGIYASPGYLAGVGVPSHPAELAQPQHRVVSFQRTFSGKAAPLHLRRGSEQVSVEGRYIVAVDDGNACLSAGLAGLGALWLPRYMADRHVERGELAALFPDWAVDSMPLHVVYAPHRHVNARLRVFIEWVAELMSVHAPITSGPRPDAVPLAAAKRRRSTPRS